MVVKEHVGTTVHLVGYEDCFSAISRCRNRFKTSFKLFNCSLEFMDKIWIPAIGGNENNSSD